MRQPPEAAKPNPVLVFAALVALAVVLLLVSNQPAASGAAQKEKQTQPAILFDSPQESLSVSRQASQTKGGAELQLELKNVADSPVGVTAFSVDPAGEAFSSAPAGSPLYGDLAVKEQAIAIGAKSSSKLTASSSARSSTDGAFPVVIVSSAALDETQKQRLYSTLRELASLRLSFAASSALGALSSSILSHPQKSFAEKVEMLDALKNAYKLAPGSHPSLHSGNYLYAISVQEGASVDERFRNTLAYVVLSRQLDSQWQDGVSAEHEASVLESLQAALSDNSKPFAEKFVEANKVVSGERVPSAPIATSAPVLSPSTSSPAPTLRVTNTSEETEREIFNFLYSGIPKEPTIAQIDEQAVAQDVEITFSSSAGTKPPLVRLESGADSLFSQPLVTSVPTKEGVEFTVRSTVDISTLPLKPDGTVDFDEQKAFVVIESPLLPGQERKVELVARLEQHESIKDELDTYGIDFGAAEREVTLGDAEDALVDELVLRLQSNADMSVHDHVPIEETDAEAGLSSPRLSFQSLSTAEFSEAGNAPLPELSVSDGGWVCPVDSPPSEPDELKLFGSDVKRGSFTWKRQGLGIPVQPGAIVRASLPGYVVKIVRKDKWCGEAIRIYHGTRTVKRTEGGKTVDKTYQIETSYCHLRGFSKKIEDAYAVMRGGLGGDTEEKIFVSAGEPIGYAGRSGDGYLHWVVYENEFPSGEESAKDRPVDPYQQYSRCIRIKQEEALVIKEPPVLGDQSPLKKYLNKKFGTEKTLASRQKPVLYGEVALDVPPGKRSIAGPPSISENLGRGIVRGYPASKEEKFVSCIFESSKRYGVDPVFELAFGLHETHFGMAGAGRKPKHNLFGLSNGIRSAPGVIWTRGPRFKRYPDFCNSAKDFPHFIDYFYIKRGKTDVARIIPSYAPSFENDVQNYVSVVMSNVRKWRKAQQKLALQAKQENAA